MEQPFVSVVIPAYNEESRIAACVSSIAQTRYPNLEVIVVDDNSTDRTGEIASQYHANVIRRSLRGGISAARNFGLEVARGEIVAFVDADCTVDVNWLKVLISNFTDEKTAGVGGIITTKESGIVATYRSFKEREDYWRSNKPVLTHFLPGGNSAYRTRILRAIGSFDPFFAQPRGYEDYELGHRLRKKGYQLIGEPRAIVWHTSQNSLKSWVRTAFGFGYGALRFLLRYKMREFHAIQLKQVLFMAFLVMALGALVEWIPIMIFAGFVAILSLVEILRAAYSVLQATKYYRNSKYVIMFPVEIALRMCTYSGLTLAILTAAYKGVIRLFHRLYLSAPAAQ